MDFLNRAMEQAKALQQMTAEAMQKGVEQATPMVKEAVTKAQELQKTLIDQAPNVAAAAQEQYNAALKHTGAMIETGKTVLEAGAAQAQVHMATLAEQAQKAAEATRSAVHSATAPPPAEPAAGAASSTVTPPGSPQP